MKLLSRALCGSLSSSDPHPTGDVKRTALVGVHSVCNNLLTWMLVPESFSRIIPDNLFQQLPTKEGRESSRPGFDSRPSQIFDFLNIFLWCNEPKKRAYQGSNLESSAWYSWNRRQTRYPLRHKPITHVPRVRFELTTSRLWDSRAAYCAIEACLIVLFSRTNNTLLPQLSITMQYFFFNNPQVWIIHKLNNREQGDVAQMVEYSLSMRRVQGSIPCFSIG